MKLSSSRFSILSGMASLAGLLALGTQCSPFANKQQADTNAPSALPALANGRPNRSNNSGSSYAGNTNSRMPSNVVGPQRSYRKISTQNKVIAMTFDDGPHPSLTPRLLDILRQRGIKATFYVVGNRCREYAGVMRKISADGHEFGNHTWTHPLSPGRWGRQSLEGEINKCHDAIVATAGTAPKTYRPPGGSVSPAQMDWLLADHGYPTILWAVDPNDWKDRNAEIVTNRILNQTKSGDIVLTHDIHRTTIDAMPATLDGLLNRGFRFVPVSQLIAIGEGKVSANGEAKPEEAVKMMSFSFSPGGQ